MRDFLNAAKLLLLDLASTLFFLLVFLLTHNTVLVVGLGIALGLVQSVATWAVVMPFFGIVSKVVVFLAGFAAMRLIGRRRVRAMPAVERDALLAATGRA